MSHFPPSLSQEALRAWRGLCIHGLDKNACHTCLRRRTRVANTVAAVIIVATAAALGLIYAVGALC